MNTMQRKCSTSRLLCVALCSTFLYSGMPAMAYARSDAVVRSIVLSSQQLGAHGFGYGFKSLERMSNRLLPEDVATLLSLYAAGGGSMSIGAVHGLASLCRAGLDGVMQAVKNGTFRPSSHKSVNFTDAQMTLDLILHFEKCDLQTKQMAHAARKELNNMERAVHKRIEGEAEKRRAEDARITANGIELLSKDSVATLTRAEREEAFRRSMKESGLDGPRTEEQERLVKRMYETMVLQLPTASGNSPDN